MQNNPIRYTDPTGHWLVEDPDGDPCTYVACLPSEPDPPSGGGSPDGGNQNDGWENTSTGEHDQIDFVTNFDAIDLLFDPFYGPVWYDITLGYPESAFAYREMLRNLMMSGGIYGPDSYATLRLQVALALPQENGMPGSDNSILFVDAELYTSRVGWEPYDTFLGNMGLDTGFDNVANYEPYFLQGLMNTSAGTIALDKAKRAYLNRRNLGSAADADVLNYLIGTCTGCGGG